MVNPPSVNGPSPSFPMENKILSNTDAEKVVESIFNRVIEENKNSSIPKIENPMSVGGGLGGFDNYTFYSPHNFRRWFDFNKMGVQAKEHLDFEYMNSTEMFFKDYKECNIKVKKHTIEITNKINHKAQHKIDTTTSEGILAQMEAIRLSKEEECIQVLKIFMAEFGGHSNFQRVNKRSEEKIWDSEITRLIGDKLVWHTKVSKKVYNEKNVEFNNEVSASTFVDNAALHKFSPHIADRLSAVITMQENFFTKFIPIHEEHAINIRTHTAVLKGIDGSFKRFNNLLGDKQRKEREEKSQTSLRGFQC